MIHPSWVALCSMAHSFIELDKAVVHVITLVNFLAMISKSLIQFTLIHGPNIPGSYAILLFTALDLAYITSPINNWVLFLLWLRLFILSGVSSLLI